MTAESIAKKHGIEDVDSLRQMIASAEKAYRRGADMESGQIASRGTAKRTSKLKRAIARVRSIWKELEPSDRRHLEWHYAQTQPWDESEQDMWAGFDSQPMDNDLRHMYDSCVFIEECVVKGRIPKYTTRFCLIIIFDYWRNLLGKTSKSNRFLGFAEDVISEFGDPTNVRGVWERFKKNPGSASSI
jgi:hypothetical protein